MGQFRYVGGGERTYEPADAPAFAVAHGDVHEMDEAPDGNWEPVAEKTSKAKPAATEE